MRSTTLSRSHRNGRRSHGPRILSVLILENLPDRREDAVVPSYGPRSNTLRPFTLCSPVRMDPAFAGASSARGPPARSGTPVRYADC
jgi:hypothetical protein